MTGRRKLFLEIVIPTIIVLLMMLNPQFYPLILLPFIYLVLVERKDIGTIGFQKENAISSATIGAAFSVIVIAVYYPMHMHYTSISSGNESPTLFILFTDVIWYPIYEEIAFRGFFISHLTDGAYSWPRDRRSLSVNTAQTLLFVSIHWHLITTGIPLMLIPIFILGFLSGILFLRFRNIYGCIACHSMANVLALLIV